MQHLWSTARNEATTTDGKGSRTLDPVPAEFYKLSTPLFHGLIHGSSCFSPLKPVSVSFAVSALQPPQPLSRFRETIPKVGTECN